MRERLALLLLLAAASHLTAGEHDVHPLLPGLRSPELWHRDWPRTLHDGLASGFSPLTCGLSQAPVVLAKIDLGGRANEVSLQRFADGSRALLVNDGHWHCLRANGDQLWESAQGGSIIYFGNVQTSPASITERLILAGGNRLIMLDAHTGELVWTHTFEPPHAHVQAVVGDILSERPGLELALVLAYTEEGALFGLGPGNEPELIWQRNVVVPGEFTERHDHGCRIVLDLHDVDQPMIWNVRRFRCQGIDARKGNLLSSLRYEIGGAERRNYGPLSLCTSKRGDRFLTMVAERVQLHVHGIRLHADQTSELAWQHYYGEAYTGQPGVALASLAIDDLDGDGETDVLYSVRDPAANLRSFVRMRSAATGRIEWELPDHWGVSVLVGTSEQRPSLVIACADPHRLMAQQGELKAYLLEKGQPPHCIAAFESAGLAGMFGERADPAQVLVRFRGDVDMGGLGLYACEAGALVERARSSASLLQTSVLHGMLAPPESDPILLLSQQNGQIAAASWDGQLLWSRPMRGGAAPSVSAADLDGDGCAELVALTPQNTARIMEFPSLREPKLRAELDHVARWEFHSPLVYDLLRSGRPCLVAPIAGPEGRLRVRACQGDGNLVWESPDLDVQARNMESFVAQAGLFLPGGGTAVMVSVRDDRMTHEGTYLLEGTTGKILWFRGLYERNGIFMPIRAHGVPTAVDVDDDGVAEIGMDMLSYMAFLNGEDASFAILRHSANISAADATYAGRLYGTYLPLENDGQRYWLAKGGHGPFGLMYEDTTRGVWREDLDYDVPINVGLIDVDGDGELEAGYAARNSRQFICRDVMTGDIEWTVELPQVPNAPCLSADVDGDGCGDFLMGPYCVEWDGRDGGRVKWVSPTAMGWGLIGDFDGDGQGEIACPGHGEVVILGR